ADGTGGVPRGASGVEPWDGLTQIRVFQRVEQPEHDNCLRGFLEFKLGIPDAYLVADRITSPRPNQQTFRLFLRGLANDQGFVQALPLFGGQQPRRRKSGYLV